MKRKFKPLAIAVFLAMATMSSSSVVNAWGFPVADIANLTQMVEGYIQDLKNYDEYIQTTILNQEQLAEALRLYKQTLVAYDGIASNGVAEAQAESQDWNALFASYKDILDLYPTQTQRSDAEWERINAKVDQVYARGQKMVELQSIVDAIPFKGNGRETVASDLNRAITRSDLAVSQSNTVEKFNQKLKDNMEDLTYLDENRLSLGDEDNLRTLQFLAEQNQKALELQVESMAQSNSRMLFSNQLASHVFSKDKENQEASLKELEEKRKQKIKVDNSPLANW